VFTSPVHLLSTHFKVEEVREAAGQIHSTSDYFSSCRGRQREDFKSKQEVLRHTCAASLP